MSNQHPKSHDEIASPKELPQSKGPIWPIGSISRGPYLAGQLLVWIAYFLVDARGHFAPTIGLVLLIAAPIATIILTVNRLRNIGVSGFWALTIFIPLVNIILHALCLSLPEGYSRTKKIDLTGWLVLGFYVTIIVLFMALILFVGLAEQ